MEWKALVDENPDYIVVMPCGWDIPKARQEMAGLERRPEWAGLRAVRNGKVYLTDGNQYFNRPGPRIVESLEILAEIVYPKKFHFGHQGKGWQLYTALGK
jgi:iron complex transport system substrate-binding protein